MSGNGSFLGTGFSFPIGVDNTGNIAQSRYENSIADSIHIILSTSRGERVMRPDFGCDLNDLVFAPNNARTLALAKHYVEEALTRWEHRIVLQDVSVQSDPDRENQINVKIRYLVRSVNTYFNMVYPFYLERGELDTQSQLG
ncbi:GPW/gp25 family protein [Alkalispirochaeta alkalica]|uniref:GPW/gp25 family protein n=1 Tax=Alkalispirochaeta alkalica TaxID=46356 RepID=UPI000478247A|nr:GPW/gp25 family protein [Alkalispirochaeta alkalica]